MIENINKKRIIKETKSSYDEYCVGYPGSGSYYVGFVLESSVFPENFTKKGSVGLDNINAFDMAETNGTYIGQVNMITVSSFCGPHGLLLGYDVQREENHVAPEILTPEDIKEFQGVDIFSGKNLLNSAKKLFGTVDDKKFPFLPGSHVPAAKKFISSSGDCFLYGMFAVGIPEEREKNACLLMEDVGFIKEKSTKEKRKIFKNIINSIYQIGKNQKISYKVIYADYLVQEVKKGEVGGILVASPYFLPAKNIKFK
jgi:histidine decarboxylase